MKEMYRGTIATGKIDVLLAILTQRYFAHTQQTQHEHASRR